MQTRKTLPLIAHEIINEITNYVPTRDRVSLALTCWILHNIATRLLYRHVYITKYVARRFFKTTSETQMPYPSYVRSLHFSSTSRSDIYLTYTLFCAAIPKLRLLRSLTIIIRPHFSLFFLHLLRRKNILQPQRLPCPTPILDGSTPIPFPNLKHLVLHGDVNLSQFARRTNLTSITISEQMSITDLFSFINNVTEGSNMNTSILMLVLSFNEESGSKITAAIWLLGFAFPNLTSLYIRIRNVNALDISRMLGADTSAFSSLRVFSLNDWSIAEPIFFIPEEMALEIQKAHITKAGEARINLERVQFGVVHWTKTHYNSEWKVRRHPSDGSVANHPTQAYLDFPLTWETHYDEMTLIPEGLFLF